jgi:hypothetical protein
MFTVSLQPDQHGRKSIQTGGQCVHGMARVSQAQLKHHDPTKTRRPAVRLPARVRPPLPPACLPWVAQSWLPDGPERMIDSCAACSISTLESVNHGFPSHLQRESQDECGDALGALDALDEFLVEAEQGALKRTTATARRPSARAMSGPRRPRRRTNGNPVRGPSGVLWGLAPARKQKGTTRDKVAVGEPNRVASPGGGMGSQQV